MKSRFAALQNDPSAAPGVEHAEIAALPSSTGHVLVTCVDYGPDQVVEQQIDDLNAFLGRHRPEWARVRWINVDGLSDMGVIHALATKYELHPLAIEDLLNLGDRPKVEPYGGEDADVRARLFIVARTLELKDEQRLVSHQISMFLGHSTVLTFRETGGNVWDHVRQRLGIKGSRIRNHDASFLVYSLLDAVVDRCFPILEHYGDQMSQIETVLLDSPRPEARGRVDQIKQDLLLLRWAMWPTREMVALLQREPHECVSDDTRVYLRDLQDHVVQIIEINEIFRERAGDLSNSYLSAVSHHTNQVMKVLTIIGTIFIPLTFLAGVYGMNFRHFPELDLTWAYPAFWIICLVVGGSMLVLFRRKGWL
jgi:magnesium transporter